MTGGLAATRPIRALEAERGQPPVPILALTANAWRRQLRPVPGGGHDGFLAKPFDRADLDEAIARLARRSAA